MLRSKKKPEKKVYGKLGKQLQDKRKKKNITLAHASFDTKIKPANLTKFEDGLVDLDNPYERGLLISYATYLGLKTESLEDKKPELSPKKQARASKKTKPLKRIQRSQRTVVASSSAKNSLAFGFVALAFGGVALLIFIFFSAPKLTISNLPDQLETTETSILIEGSTGSGSDVFINATPVPVSPEGDFSQNVFLNPGINIVVIEAENNLSRRARVEKIIFADYQPFD